MDTYIDIGSVADFPSFHDAELRGIEHDPEARSLTLRFRRVGGEVEVLKFFEVVAQRLIDFAGQNVASRLLISPKHTFTSADAQTWVQWINSRDDSKGTGISGEEGDKYASDFRAGRLTLFVLEPSCGAEMAVLCESVSIKR
ncbi:hypothetical protein VSR34_26855 [Paraburkholderia sp. JHI2823]|uniref:hypothetical protein n=1 Tax=Paraburkholderia TaxID=1822464 RepID=UPI00041C2195|nr:hypothetical protein [Paraburkholderia mimosarum]